MIQQIIEDIVGDAVKGRIDHQEAVRRILSVVTAFKDAKRPNQPYLLYVSPWETEDAYYGPHHIRATAAPYVQDIPFDVFDTTLMGPSFPFRCNYA